MATLACSFVDVDGDPQLAIIYVIVAHHDERVTTALPGS
jgi:hypothetical protein